MKLSIIVPIYNAEKYLEECILSVIKCKRKEVEVLLIDDGSKDNSYEICKKFKEDKRIKIIHKNNEGVSVARNIGIENATGDYLMFLDADDYILEDKWSLIISYLDKEYDFVGFSYNSLFSNGKTIYEPFFFKNNSYTTCNYNEILNILFGTPMLYTCWGKLFNRHIIKNNNIRFKKNIKIGEDYLFVLDYFKLIKNPILINEAILNYRQNIYGVMKNFNYTLRKNTEEMIYKYCISYINNIKNNSVNIKEIKENFYYYKFRSLTKLILDINSSVNFSNSYKNIKDLLCSNIILEILNKVDTSKLHGIKKIEYRLLINEKFLFLLMYFKLKSLVGKIK